MPAERKALKTEIDVIVRGVDRGTGEITDFDLKTKSWSKNLLRGRELDLAKIDRPVLIVFDVKNRTELSMSFDENRPNDCLWVTKGRVCPQAPGDSMEIRVAEPSRDRARLKVWNPNNQAGEFAYRLNLDCPDVKGGTAWLDPVIVNSGSGGGGFEPPQPAPISPGLIGGMVAIAAGIGLAALLTRGRERLPRRR